MPYKDIEKKRLCQKKYYLKNKKKCNAATALWQKNNKDKVNQKTRRWRAKNMPILLENNKRWLAKNPWYHGFRKAMKKSKAIGAKAFVKDYDALISFYRAKPSGMVVDHIVPFKGKAVCGLNVSWNLQYLTPAENLAKGRKFEVLCG